MKPRWQSVKEGHTEACPVILLVEGEDDLRASRRLLLSCISADVRVLNPSKGRVDVEQSIPVGLVVIPVDAACRTEEIACLTRRQWPRAKILLLGKSCDDLQDALYDDIVDACSTPVSFVEVSRRLLGQYLQSSSNSGSADGERV